MQTITAVIPAKNEEKNIERCLKSLLWCDKVIVISSGTDKTAGLAKKLGAEVIIKKSEGNDDFELLQRNLNEIINFCTTDWILRVDADEVVTPELVGEIKQVLKRSTSQFVAYGIPRRQYFIRKFLRGGDWAYDRLTRLFRPKFCRYDPIVKVHEQFKVNGKIGYLKEPLLHFSHPDMKTLMKKFDSYTTLEARELKENKISAFFKLIFLPPYIFLRWMIYHRGYRDGWTGVEAGYIRAYYDILVYTKYLGIKKLS